MIERGVPESRLDKRLHLRIRQALVVNERLDRAVEAGIGELFEVFRSSAEARMREQVCARGRSSIQTMAGAKGRPAMQQVPETMECAELSSFS
jgi:hypothetical protein